jgi:surface protein
MFFNCKLLESINISNWDTSNVTDISFIFFNCISLKSSPNISKWNIKNITNGTNIFTTYENLKNITDFEYDENNINQMFNFDITIKYKIDKNEDFIQLFGVDFVMRNKDFCYILLDGKKIELCSELNIKEYQKEKSDILEIKLIETIPITDLSFMFVQCYSLKSVNFSKMNTKRITDIGCMFYDCQLLESVSGIEKWNTKNILDMNNMFNNCFSLKSLPDISKWNTKNLKKMKLMFQNCISLKPSPDTSKWDTRNVIDCSDNFFSFVNYIEFNRPKKRRTINILIN